MSRSLQSYPIPASFTTFEGMLRLLDNPKQFKAYITEMREVIDAVNDRIAELNEVKAIGKTLAAARARQAEAETMVRDATSSKAAADRAVKDERSKISRESQAWADQKEREQAIRSDQEEAISAKGNDLDTRASKIEEAESEIAAARLALEKDKVAFVAHKTQVLAAMGAT